MEQSLEQTLKSLDERLKELETKFKALSSILGEYVAQLDVLEEALVNNKKNISNTLSLEDSLDKNNQDNIVDTQGIVPRQRNIEPAIPLSNLVFSSIEDSETTTDELQRKVSEVADLIIRTGKSLDYISNR